MSPPIPLSCAPLSVGDAGDLLCGAAEEDEGEGKDQAEQHAEDTHGTALLQGHLEPLQDGTADHDANHRPRDVPELWGCGTEGCGQWTWWGGLGLDLGISDTFSNPNDSVVL